MKNIEALNPNWIYDLNGMPQAITDHVKNQFREIAYGDDPLQKLDVYLPDEKQGLLPVILMIHGGGFMRCDKHDFHLYPMFYALERGFAVVAMNYRLSPKVVYPAHLTDVYAVLDWLGLHADDYGLDRRNVYLWGSSAGGHLALMAGMKREHACASAFPRLGEIEIRAIAALCPALGFGRMSREGYGPLSQMARVVVWQLLRKKVFGSFKPSIEAMRDSDPATYLPGGIAPLYLQQGTKDPIISTRDILAFAKEAGRVLDYNDLVMDVLEGVAHAGAGPEFFLKEHINPILDFFEQHRVKRGN